MTAPFIWAPFTPMNVKTLTKLKQNYSFMTSLQTQDIKTFSGVKYTRDLKIFLTYPQFV